MTSGLLGVPFGSYLAQRLRPRYPDVDPIICACGLLLSSPFVYFALIVAKYSITWCYVFIFFAEITLNLCWSLVADILLVRKIAIGYNNDQCARVGGTEGINMNGFFCDNLCFKRCFFFCLYCFFILKY